LKEAASLRQIPRQRQISANRADGHDFSVGLDQQPGDSLVGTLQQTPKESTVPNFVSSFPA